MITYRYLQLRTSWNNNHIARGFRGKSIQIYFKMATWDLPKSYFLNKLTCTIQKIFPSVIRNRKVLFVENVEYTEIKVNK